MVPNQNFREMIVYLIAAAVIAALLVVLTGITFKAYRELEGSAARKPIKAKAQATTKSSSTYMPNEADLEGTWIAVNSAEVSQLREKALSQALQQVKAAEKTA